MNLTGLKAIEFEGSLIGVSYTNGDEVVGIPTSSKNRMYQELLDSINTDGADAWEETIATYADIPEALRTAAESKLFNQQLAAYKQATLRLAQYIVAEGRTEVVESQPTGEQVWDENTNEMVNVMQDVITVTAIEAVEASVEQTTYDDEGNATTTTVENPLITQDNTERAAAQAIVDATPQPVKDAVND